MSKTLTVAVPSYNVEKYLDASLTSYVAGVADDRLEVIVVDDGSADGTAEIARGFCERFPGIFRLVSQENGGHGAAINTGMRHATGKYFRIIDADDRICTASIPALLDALDEAEDDLVVDVKREVHIDTGESALLALPGDLPRGESIPFDAVCARDDIEAFFIIHTVCMRTDFLRSHNVSLLEHTFYVDYELIVKVAAHAATIRFLDLEGCNYYLGNDEQSVAPANYVRRWSDHSRVTEAVLEFADSTHLPPARQLFVNKRVQLVVNTHYNIALIYDDDRDRGLARAREFRAMLHRRHYPFFVAGERRYRQALMLHRLGFDAAKLDRLMGRA